MSYLILGIALLAGIMLAGRWYVNTDPKILLKLLKWILIGSILAIATFFALTGRLTFALAALPALLPWIIRLRRAAQVAKAYHRMSQKDFGRSSGQSSAVRTQHLHMELDHETGKMWGYILNGQFKGYNLCDIKDEEMMELLREYQSNDYESAQVLEAYLDRERSDWRKQTNANQGNSENNFTQSQPGAMTREEAYDVLGLECGSPEDVIRDAHRRLIANLHPDKGGSTFLAAKVNQAKDILLDG